MSKYSTFCIANNSQSITSIVIGLKRGKRLCYLYRLWPVIWPYGPDPLSLKKEICVNYLD